MKRLIFFCCLLVAIGGLSFCNCYPQMFRWIIKIPVVGGIVGYNFPPHDFDTPLAEIPLAEGVHVLTFRGTYEGRYEVQISPIRGSTIESSLDEHNTVAMRVQAFNSNNELLFQQAHSSSRLWGGKWIDGMQVYHYCYGIFFAPKDFPLDECITMKIECTGDVQTILARNPSSKIQITKWTDK
jgi:hypothetical protein